MYQEQLLEYRVNPFYSQPFLLVENNKNKLSLVQLGLFGADMPMQVVDSKKTQSLVLHFSKQLTRDISPIHLELLLTEEQ